MAPPGQYGQPWGPPPHPPAPRRSKALPIVLAVVAALVVLAAAILVPWLLTREDEDGDRGADDPGRSGDPSGGESVDTGNLDLVRSYDDLTNQHLGPGESVEYPQSPAVGGDHAAYWIDCGVYDEPVPEANAVHDLEHGTTWITYRDDLVDEDGIDRLADQLPTNGIMSPYPDQEAPVVITVWGRQLELTGPEDPRIALFITEYGAGDTAPEPFASCHGGVDPATIDETGGDVAA